MEPPKRARLKFQIGRKTVFAKKVDKPARKGQPFLREAAEEMQKQGWEWLFVRLNQDIKVDLSNILPDIVNLKINL